MIVAGYMDFASLGSLLCGPVEVTFVLSEISVISARQVFAEYFAESSVCSLYQVPNVSGGVTNLDGIYGV